MPRIKRCYRIEMMPPEGAVVLSERGEYVLTGKAWGALIPLIDGQRTTDEIVEALHGIIGAAEVFYALSLLKQKGLIVEHKQDQAERAAFWEGMGIDPGKAAARLEKHSVSVRSFGDIPTEAFISALQALQISEAAEASCLDVVLTDNYLREELATVNASALRAKRPWMLVKPTGSVLWIGPLLVPERTACWACFAAYLRANNPFQNLVARRGAHAGLFDPSLSPHPSTLQTAFHLAAIQVGKWLINEDPEDGAGALVRFDTITLESKKYPLHRRPQCPVCGKEQREANRNPAPIVLSSRPKKFTQDGGYRSLLPEETLQRYQHHVDPLLGAVRTLTPLTGAEDRLTHTYCVQHLMSMKHHESALLRERLWGYSWGKGMTDAQARASGLCEALERYSGMFQGDEPRIRSTFRRLGDQAIHPNACMLFSPAQYANRRAWNKDCKNRLDRVPAPFDEDAEIEWSPVWSLTNEHFKYLPTAYCYFGYESEYCIVDSNGNAAGNNHEEAILQGFMELVERDSVALWWYNQLPKASVCLDSFDEPYFRELQAYYRSLHRTFWVLDLGTDLEIPSFAAVSICTDQPRENIIIGLGAHFDPVLAIKRALTEMNQKLSHYAHFFENAEARYSQIPIRFTTSWRNVTVEQLPCLKPDENAPEKKKSAYQQRSNGDLLADVRLCVDLASAHGLETYVLDQTRPDIGLSVVKVIVPGLRSFWRRLGRGRLYDTPLKMQWRQTPLKEHQMNPVPLFP